MALPLNITGISTAVAPVGPFVVSTVATTQAIVVVPSEGATTGLLIGSATSQGLAASFTPANTVTVTSIDVVAAINGAPTDNCYANLHTASEVFVPTGTSLGRSLDIPASSFTSEFTTQTLVFSTPITLQAGTRYALFFKRTGALDSTNCFKVARPTGDPVAGEGYATQNNLGSWSTTGVVGDIALTLNVAASYNYKYYFFCRDGTTATTLQAYKSTAPDTSWASIATRTGFTTAILNIAGYQVGNIIHLVVNDGTASTSVATKYLSFDTTTETLSTIETVAAAAAVAGQRGATVFHGSLVVRSTGEVIAFYNGAQTNTSGTPRARVYYARRTVAGVWQAGVRVDANIARDNTIPIVVLGTSDRCHFIFSDGNGTMQRHLTSANVLGTASFVMISAPTLDVATMVDGAAIKFALAAQSNGAYFTSADNPTFSASNVNTGGLGIPVRLADDNGTLYALYQVTADGDLYLKTSSNFGANYSTGVSVLAATVASVDTALSRNQLAYRSGNAVVFPYIVNDAGTWKYNEQVLRTLVIPEWGDLIAGDASVTAVGVVISPPVEGTGVLVAANAGLVSNQFISESLGTGALVAVGSTGQRGQGISAWAASGALVTGVADLDAVGTVASPPVTGTGVLVSNVTALSGVGLSRATGTGVLKAASSATVTLGTSVGTQSVFGSPTRDMVAQSFVVPSPEARSPKTATVPTFSSLSWAGYSNKDAGTSVAKPSGTLDGDLLIAHWLIGAGNLVDPTGVAAPAGWTFIAATDVHDPGGFRGQFRAFWKRADNEPAEYNFRHDGVHTTELAITCYSGVDTVGTIEAVSVNSNTAPPVESTNVATAFGVTTTSDATLLIWSGHNWDGTGTLAPPTGMTERFDGVVYVADEDRPVAGATGDRTQTLASKYPWAALLIAVKGEAEEVTASGDVSLTSVKLRLLRSATAPTDSMKVGVYAAVGDLPTGPLLGESSTLLGSSLTTTQAEKTLPLPSVPLTPGSSYCLVLSRTGALDATRTYGVECSSVSTYAGGMHSAHVSGVWNTVAANDAVGTVYFSGGLSGSGVSEVVATGALTAQDHTAVGAGISSSHQTSASLQATMLPLQNGTGISSSTGTGALAASAAVIVSSGLGPSWVGTGTLQAQPRVIVAPGIAAWLASGALTASSATVSAAGLAQWTASGSMPAQAASVAGVGVSGTEVGTGALVSAPSVVSGLGFIATGINGLGTLAVSNSAVVGPGISRSVSTLAAMAASSATIVAPGLVTAHGSGALVITSKATLAGFGGVESVGTAALISQAAVVNSTGISHWVATGVLAAQVTTITASGARSWNATGALVAGVTVVAGAGISSSGSVTSSLLAARSTVMGFEGVTLITGEGDLQAQSRVVAGLGRSISSGTGGLSGPVSALTGAGLTGSLGTGAPVSQACVISGVGSANVQGTGALVAQNRTMSGAGAVASSGTAVLAAPDRVMAGAGLSRSLGSGALVTSSTVAGAGVSAVAGSGTLTSSTASLSGTANIVTSGTGALQAANRTMSGAGFVQYVIGATPLAAGRATITASGLSSSTGVAPLQASRADVDGAQGVVIVLGAGVLQGQSRVVAGSGLSRSTGTGSLFVADSATVNGAGAVQSRGSGVLTCARSDVDGLGKVLVEGTGALESGQAVVASTGAAHWVGTGVLVAQDSDATGTGLSRSQGAGVLQVQTRSTVDGDGVVASTGTGNLSAKPARIMGSASLTTLGFGELEAQPHTLTSVGKVVAFGTGALVQGRGSLAAQGLSSSKGSGEIKPKPAQVHGFGDLTAWGTGDLDTYPATVTGSNLVEGTSVIEATASQVVGSGEVGVFIPPPPDDLPGRYPGTRVWAGYRGNATTGPILPPPPWWLGRAA
jgi:hypothetical protein